MRTIRNHIITYYTVISWVWGQHKNCWTWRRECWAWGRKPEETFSYSGATIHLLPESQSMTVLLYPSLICLEQPVTPSFVSYQTTSLSALNFGRFRSVEFRWKLISCNVAVKQMRCWTGRHVNIEIVRPDEITFVLLEFLLVRII